MSAVVKIVDGSSALPSIEEIGESATSAAAEIGVVTAMLRREAEQPNHEEQFYVILRMGLQRIEALADQVLGRLGYLDDHAICALQDAAERDATGAP